MSTDASTHGNVPFHSDADVAQKLEALKNDARQGQPMPTQGSTYLSRAVADAGAELGRWRHLSETTHCRRAWSAADQLRADGQGA